MFCQWRLKRTRAKWLAEVKRAFFTAAANSILNSKPDSQHSTTHWKWKTRQVRPAMRLAFAGVCTHILRADIAE